MYSYADRLRAVELYIRLGKRLNATIRQLGYPTKNALRGWYREYLQHLDLRTQPVARAPKYSQAQRQAALEHFRTHDRCISATMRALGYPGRGTLTAWVREAFPEARTSMVGRSWHPGYSEEVRQAGVIGLCSGDESAQQVADRLGVSRPTLYSWKDQLLGHEAPSSMKRRKSNPKLPEREELERQLEALQRDVRQLQLEHDLLKKANELLKKDLGVDLQILSNREKTQLIDALKEVYRLPELLAQLRIARSSYFYHRARMCLADKYAAVRHSLAEIFETNRRCYGYRRLQASLARQSVVISEKVVQRLMKQEQLVVARPRRRRFGSYLGEISPAPENLINRDFHAEAPNVKWLTDITEFQIPAGKVYLSPIIDCFDGMVISWSIGTQPDAGLVNTMLDAAIETVANGEERPIIHSATRRRRAEKAENGLGHAPAARTIVRLMTLERINLTKAQAMTVAAIEERLPDLVEARDVVESFHNMLRHKSKDDLESWIDRAAKSLVASFANGVIRDQTAAQNAITSQWSNGQTEGQITKLKLIKRQMYGRGKLDLLQARIVGAP